MCFCSLDCGLNKPYAYLSDKPTSKHIFLTKRESASTKKQTNKQKKTHKIRRHRSDASYRAQLTSNLVCLEINDTKEVTFLNQTKEHSVKNNTYVPLIRTEKSSICSAVAGLSHTRIFTARDVSQLGWLMRDIKCRRAPSEPESYKTCLHTLSRLFNNATNT